MDNSTSFLFQSFYFSAQEVPSGKRQIYIKRLQELPEELRLRTELPAIRGGDETGKDREGKEATGVLAYHQRAESEEGRQQPVE